MELIDIAFKAGRSCEGLACDGDGCASGLGPTGAIMARRRVTTLSVPAIFKSMLRNSAYFGRVNRMRIRETFYSRSLAPAIFAASLLTACGNSDSLPSGPVVAEASTQPPLAVACSALVGTSVPAAEIGLPAKDAVIASATLVKAGDANNTNGEYCKVLGMVLPHYNRTQPIA